MPDSTQIAELKERFATIQQRMSDVYAAGDVGGGRYDFSRKPILDATGAPDAAGAVAKVKEWSRELESLGRELEQNELAEGKRHLDAVTAARATPVHLPTAPAGNGSDSYALKSFGDRFTHHPVFAEAWLKHRTIGVPATIDIELKTLMTRAAGYGPESTRTGLMVEYATRPIQVLELFPTRPITQAVDKYMEETTRTHNAAEKGEGVAYAESEFAWTERTETVQKITDSVPVTDEQLEDAPEVAGILNQRLTFGLRQRLETQCLVGNGTAPNLSGILDRVIQTMAKGSDDIFTATFKAISLVRHTGFAEPNAIIMNPNDWLAVRTAQYTTGEYIMGPPNLPGAQQLYGLPVALAGALTENTMLVGDFANFCYIGERRGIDIQIGYSGTQFAEGKKLIRADVRCELSVTRPYAFCSVTGV